MDWRITVQSSIVHTDFLEKVILAGELSGIFISVIEIESKKKGSYPIGEFSVSIWFGFTLPLNRNFNSLLNSFGGYSLYRYEFALPWNGSRPCGYGNLLHLFKICNV